MTDALSAKTMEILRQSEEEMLYIKQNYNELLRAFNYNLDLLKERDLELGQQDAQIQELKQAVKSQKSASLLYDKLLFAESQLENYKLDHYKLNKYMQAQLKQIAGLLYEKEDNLAENQKMSIMLASTKTSLEGCYEQLKHANAQIADLAKEKSRHIAELSAKRQENETIKYLREYEKECAYYLRDTSESLKKQILLLNSYVFELKQDNQRLGLEYLKGKENATRLYYQLDACKEDYDAFVKEVKRRHKDIKLSSKQLESDNYKLQYRLHKYETENDMIMAQHAYKCYNYEQMLSQFEQENVNLRYKCQKLEDEVRRIDLSYAGQINYRQANINVLTAEKDKILLDCQQQVKQLSTYLYGEKLKAAYLFSQLQDVKVDKVKAEKSGEYQLVIAQMRYDFEKAVYKVSYLEQQLYEQRSDAFNTQNELNSIRNLLEKAKLEKSYLEAQNQYLTQEIGTKRQYLLMYEADRLNVYDLGILERLKSKLKEASQTLKDLSAQNEELERNCRIYREKYMQLLENRSYPVEGILPHAPRPDALREPEVVDAYATEAVVMDEFPSYLTFDNSLYEGIYSILKRAGI